MDAHLPLRLPDDDLVPLLRKASSDDLGILVECIHRDGSEDLSSVPAFQAQNPRAGDNIYDGDHRVYADDIAAEIQRYSGGTISNALRGGKGIPYIEVVHDVADHLGVNYNRNVAVARIERKILLKVLEKAYEKMSDEEKKELLNDLGVSNGLGLVPSVLPFMPIKGGLFKGLFPLALATMARQVYRPLHDLVAFRVVVPCVAHVAFLRLKYSVCPSCWEVQPATEDYCPSCGPRIEPIQFETPLTEHTAQVVPQDETGERFQLGGYSAATLRGVAAGVTAAAATPVAAAAAPVVAAAASVAAARFYVSHRSRNKDHLSERIAKELDEWRNWYQQLKSGRSDITTSPTGASALPESRAPSIASRSSSSSLEIQNENGETVLSVAELTSLPPRPWENEHESGISVLSRLSPLLSAVPTAAIARDLATTKYFSVFLRNYGVDDLDDVKNNPIIKGAKQVVVRGDNGNILEHAQLIPSDLLGNIVSANLIWQIASIVVAKKYLHDINEKLQAIGRRIEEVHTFQKNDRTSKILGCRKYFGQACADIQFGNVSSSLQTVIEAQCVELMQIEEHLRLDIKGKMGAINDDLGEEFNKLLRDWVDDMRELFVCVETRLLGYQLIAIGSQDLDAVDIRLNGVRRDVECLKDDAICFANYIGDALSDKVSFWKSISRVEGSLAVLEELQPREEFGKSFVHVHEEVGLIQNIIEQRKAPQEILLKVNGGQIDGFSVVDV